MKIRETGELDADEIGRGNLLPPPALAGYTFRGPEAYGARDNNRMLSISVEVNSSCNFRCRGCPMKGLAGQPDADIGLLSDLLGQAAEMGCRSVVFTGGEPLMYPGIGRLIELASAKGMVPVLSTNAALVFNDIAAFLFSRGASVLLRIDSLDPALQDRICGKDGAFTLMRNGLRNLLNAGFPGAAGEHPRLGASFRARRSNAAGAEDVWRFCRANMIVPEFVISCPSGEVTGDDLPASEAGRLKLRLSEIDREEYGYDWNGFIPIPASGCLRYLYGMHITLKGDARPCAYTRIDEHPDFLKNGEYPLNVKHKTLREIYHSGPMYYCRHIDSFLEGKCKNCGFLSQCVGCGGYAFATGIAAGKGPLQALASEYSHCLK